MFFHSILKRMIPGGCSVRGISGACRRSARWPALMQRQPLLPGLMAAGAVAAALAATPAAEARNYWSSTGLYYCTSSSRFPALNLCPPLKPNGAFIAMFDFAPDPTARLASFNVNFKYDPTLLSFNKDATTLLCDLSRSSIPLCPNVPPGQGTTPLIGTSGDYVVDQTGLVITNDPSGLPSVSVSYAAASPLTLSGERNFLALAFDLLVPLQPGASITYSPTLPTDATFSVLSADCRDEYGALMNCASNHPSASFKLNPVPAPLAVGGLPVLVHASRRIRRRVRLAAEAR